MKLYGYIYYNHNVHSPQWRTLITKKLDLDKLYRNEGIEFPYDYGKVTVMKLYNIQEYNFDTNENILSDCYANPQWFINYIYDRHHKKYSILRYLDAQKSVDLYMPWPDQDPDEWKEIKATLEYRFRKGKGRSTYTYRAINVIDQFPKVEDLTTITTELLASEIKKLGKNSEINNSTMRFVCDSNSIALDKRSTNTIIDDIDDNWTDVIDQD